MWDLARNGKNKQDDYNRIKKTIQEIVGMPKIKKPLKPTKFKRKKEEPLDKSENLMRQFFGLQQFQKGLAAATLDGGKQIDSKKLSVPKDPTESSSSGESEGKDEVAGSSSSDSRRAVIKNHTKERAKREEYNTDELSDTSSSEDSEQQEGNTEKGTFLDESYSKVTNSNYDNVPKHSSGLADNEYTSVQPVKKKITLSSSELTIIKELCRDLIKKEEKPKEDSNQKTDLLIEDIGVNSFQQFRSIEETDVVKNEPDLVKHKEYETLLEKKEKKKFKNEPEKNKCQKYNIETHNIADENFNIDTENSKKHEYNVKPQNSSVPNLGIVESPIYVSTFTEDKKQKLNIEIENTEKQVYNTQLENCPVLNLQSVEPQIYINTSTEETQASLTIQNELNEITDYNHELNDEIRNTVLVQGKLTLISEQKEEKEFTITNDDDFEKVHLEIVTKETCEEVDEWKERIEETVVIEKTVKMNPDEAEVIEIETVEVEQEMKEVNMSDDDLIRKTIREMDQIDREFLVAKTPPEDGLENYYYSEIGDGDKIEEGKNDLQERIDRLQEQIFSLRKQLEEVKRQNEEEAKEVEHLSALLVDRDSSLLRSSLDWDEWELKEMIRERLQQRRQAAAQEYEARLRVVEALCSAEMGRLEDALETLLPLNATVNAWDTPAEPQDLRSSSWQTQDYIFEVVTSMNVSSSDENGVSGTISTNGEQPSLTERKAEHQ